METNFQAITEADRLYCTRMLIALETAFHAMKTGTVICSNEYIKIAKQDISKISVCSM